MIDTNTICNLTVSATFISFNTSKSSLGYDPDYTYTSEHLVKELIDKLELDIDFGEWVINKQKLEKIQEDKDRKNYEKYLADYEKLETESSSFFDYIVIFLITWISVSGFIMILTGTHSVIPGYVGLTMAIIITFYTAINAKPRFKPDPKSFDDFMNPFNNRNNPFDDQLDLYLDS